MQKQQQLKHFLSLMMRETSNTTATLLFTIQQDIKENFSKLIGTEAELIHTIHELGIENRLEKAVTRSGDNLQSEVTKIINSYNA